MAPLGGLCGLCGNQVHLGIPDSVPNISRPDPEFSIGSKRARAGMRLRSRIHTHGDWLNPVIRLPDGGHRNPPLVLVGRYTRDSPCFEGLVCYKASCNLDKSTYRSLPLWSACGMKKLRCLLQGMTSRFLLPNGTPRSLPRNPNMAVFFQRLLVLQIRTEQPLQSES